MPLTLNGTTGIAGVDGSAGTPALKGGTSSTAGIAYPAADTVSIATASTERVRVDSSGNLLVGVTSANANGGVLQLKSGITFPATQVSASDVNTLDDYEEGTWTPAVYHTSSNNSTWTTKSGYYRKIGSQVTCWFVCDGGNSGTSGSSLAISGFPFASSGMADNVAVGTWGANNLTPSAANVEYTGGGFYIYNGGVTLTAQTSYITGVFTYFSA